MRRQPPCFRAGLKVGKHLSLGRNDVVAIETSPVRQRYAPALRLDERWSRKRLIVDQCSVGPDHIREWTP